MPSRRWSASGASRECRRRSSASCCACSSACARFTRLPMEATRGRSTSRGGRAAGRASTPAVAFRSTRTCAACPRTCQFTAFCATGTPPCRSRHRRSRHCRKRPAVFLRRDARGSGGGTCHALAEALRGNRARTLEAGHRSAAWPGRARRLAGLSRRRGARTAYRAVRRTHRRTCASTSGCGDGFRVCPGVFEAHDLPVGGLGLEPEKTRLVAGGLVRASERVPARSPWWPTSTCSPGARSCWNQQMRHAGCRRCSP